MSDVKVILEDLAKKLTPEAKEKLNAVIGLELDSIPYTIDARKDGQGVLEGAPSAHGLEPRFSMASSGDDYVKIIRGELNPMMAAMTGKLKVSGDIGFAMNLSSLLS
jgi:putative sterol carrier protein